MALVVMKAHPAFAKNFNLQTCEVLLIACPHAPGNTEAHSGGGLANDKVSSKKPRTADID
jgi:hypothetical protein